MWQNDPLSAGMFCSRSVLSTLLLWEDINIVELLCVDSNVESRLLQPLLVSSFATRRDACVETVVVTVVVMSGPTLLWWCWIGDADGNAVAMVPVVAGVERRAGAGASGVS